MRCFLVPSGTGVYRVPRVLPSSREMHGAKLGWVEGIAALPWRVLKKLRATPGGPGECDFGPGGPYPEPSCPPDHLPVCFSACLALPRLPSLPASQSVGVPSHLLSGCAGWHLCISVTRLPGLHPISLPADFLPVCQPLTCCPSTCPLAGCLSALLSACETRDLSLREAQRVILG